MRRAQRHLAAVFFRLHAMAAAAVVPLALLLPHLVWGSFALALNPAFLALNPGR